MTNINDIYGGDWLRADDLKGHWPATVTIAGWDLAEFQDDRTGAKKKQVALSFQGADKRLGLNKTNAARIAEHHGTVVEHWIGKQITLIVERVDAFGKITDAIRVELKQPTPTSQAPAAIPDHFAGDPDVGDIPW